MYIIPDDVIYDPPALCAMLEKNQITRILFTPSLIEAVLDTQSDETIRRAFKSFRYAQFQHQSVNYINKGFFNDHMTEREFLVMLLLQVDLAVRRSGDNSAAKANSENTAMGARGESVFGV